MVKLMILLKKWVNLSKYWDIYIYDTDFKAFEILPTSKRKANPNWLLKIPGFGEKIPRSGHIKSVCAMIIIVGI